MSYTADQRAALFWLGCMPARTALVLLARTPLSPAVRVFASVVAYRWLSGLDNSHVGQFGGIAWCAEQRQLHGMLFASYALSGNEAWLAADVAVGAGNWLVQKSNLSTS